MTLYPLNVPQPSIRSATVLGLSCYLGKTAFVEALLAERGWAAEHGVGGSIRRKRKNGKGLGRGWVSVDGKDGKDGTGLMCTSCNPLMPSAHSSLLTRLPSLAFRRCPRWPSRDRSDPREYTHGCRPARQMYKLTRALGLFLPRSSLMELDRMRLRATARVRSSMRSVDRRWFGCLRSSSDTGGPERER